MSLAEILGTKKAATLSTPKLTVAPSFQALLQKTNVGKAVSKNTVAALKPAPKTTISTWSQPIIPITLDPVKLISAYVQMGSGTTVAAKVNAATSLITTEKTTTNINTGKTTVQTYQDVVKENIAAAPAATQTYFNATATPVGAVTLPAVPDLLGGLGDLKNLLILGGIALIGIFAISQFSRK